MTTAVDPCQDQATGHAGPERPERSDRLIRFAALRGLLAEKHPEPPARASGFLPTGIPALDRVEGGIRKGCLTELAGMSGSGPLLVGSLLESLGREQGFGAVIDVGRFLDPGSYRAADLSRLLLVFCDEAKTAVRAADLLLRDGNLAVVCLDLQGVPPKDLRRIPASTWHRFQRLVEQSGMALVVFSPQPMVEGARVRMVLHTAWSLDALIQRRSRLVETVQGQVFVRASSGRADGAGQRISGLTA